MRKKLTCWRLLPALALASGILFISMTAHACSATLSSFSFSTSALPAAYVNVSYESLVVVTGGLPPYTYVIYSGSLPPGLYINPRTGAIYGVPTTAGRYTFVCRVYDARFPPFWIQRTFTITVTSP